MEHVLTLHRQLLLLFVLPTEHLLTKHVLLPSCPLGYERNASGICVPIVNPDPNGGDSDGTETETEQEIGQKNVCSGWAVCTNDAENREDSAIEDTNG
jgi:hypothetical protein